MVSKDKRRIGIMKLNELRKEDLETIKEKEL